MESNHSATGDASRQAYQRSPLVSSSSSMGVDPNAPSFARVAGSESDSASWIFLSALFIDGSPARLLSAPLARAELVPTLARLRIARPQSPWLRVEREKYRPAKDHRIISREAPAGLSVGAPGHLYPHNSRARPYSSHRPAWGSHCARLFTLDAFSPSRDDPLLSIARE